MHQTKNYSVMFLFSPSANLVKMKFRSAPWVPQFFFKFLNIAILPIKSDLLDLFKSVQKRFNFNFYLCTLETLKPGMPIKRRPSVLHVNVLNDLDNRLNLINVNFPK